MSIPESFYRQSIDLNRYSNRIAREIVTNYNDVILDLTYKLATIDEVTISEGGSSGLSVSLLLDFIGWTKL